MGLPQILLCLCYAPGVKPQSFEVFAAIVGKIFRPRHLVRVERSRNVQAKASQSQGTHVVLIDLVEFNGSATLLSRSS